MCGGMKQSQEKEQAVTNLAPIRTTELLPEINRRYEMWKLMNQVPESNDYDMKGFYEGMLLGDEAATSGVDASDGEIHYSDKWKLPSHPKFSSESMYSKSKSDPYWMKNPAPYVDGTWARVSPIAGVLNIDLPMQYGAQDSKSLQNIFD